jgi:hypothetical protein
MSNPISLLKMSRRKYVSGAQNTMHAPHALHSHVTIKDRGRSFASGPRAIPSGRIGEGRSIEFIGRLIDSPIIDARTRQLRETP